MAERDRAAREREVDLLTSVMSMTAAVNVGSGALSVAYAAGPHAFH